MGRGKPLAHKRNPGNPLLDWIKDPQALRSTRIDPSRQVNIEARIFAPFHGIWTPNKLKNRPPTPQGHKQDWGKRPMGQTPLYYREMESSLSTGKSYKEVPALWLVGELPAASTPGPRRLDKRMAIL